MRPIDADAYAAEMRKRQDACRKWKSEQNEGSEMYARAEQALVTFIEAWATLEKQPTIDAIPVEWLKAQIRSYTGDVSDIGKSARNGTIKDLIRKWEKEQEARDNG